MSSLAKRVLSSIVFLPLFILLLVRGTPLYFFILASAAALIGLNEFFAFRDKRPGREMAAVGYLWALAVLVSAYVARPGFMVIAVAVGLMTLLVLRLRHAEELPQVIGDAGFIAFGIIYVPFLLAHLILLRGLDQGHLWVLLLFVVTWGGDTAAYFTGINFGRRKLCPSISPNKSVEGFIGGFGGSIAGALLFKLFFFPALSVTDGLVIALIIGFVGPLGDLSESMLKRSCGVKDSGALIPGHGGMLDRIDSILFSAPVVYFYATLRYGGGA